MGSDVKESFLQSSGYYRDDVKIDSYDNAGFVKRCADFKNGGWVQLAGSLHIDLAQQEKALLNVMDIKIELFRNSDEFCLLNYTTADTATYKIQLRKMEFYVKALTLYNSVSVGLSDALVKNDAKYPIVLPNVNRFILAKVVPRRRKTTFSLI